MLANSRVYFQDGRKKKLNEGDRKAAGIGKKYIVKGKMLV
jgi:hypothetical protein